MHTNRDFYLFVTGLQDRIAPVPTLERYLCALWSLGRARAAMPALTLGELATMIEAAFTAPPGEPPLDAIPDDGEGFAGWEHTILEQIRDLRDMAATGQLDDDQRYFGIDSPRGGRWFNFDPIGYLECATAGSFDGWEAGDDTRGFVPGKVVTTDADGALISVDPQDLTTPTTTIDQVSWDTFAGFLYCGKVYE